MLPFDLSILFKSGSVRGGVHPEARKDATADRVIDTGFPVPDMLYLPLHQHVGRPAEPVVRVGDTVHKGQMLAAGQGTVSAPVHASTSGVIVDIIDYPSAHPSALPTPTLLLEADGLDLWPENNGEQDPFEFTAKDICLKVGAAGIVGMGGAAFPSQVKLNLGRQRQIGTLIINGGECEPYLTCDDRLMRERAAEIVEGIRIMLRGLECGKAIIGIEDNKPEAITAMRAAIAPWEDSIRVAELPSLYPMGWDRQMIRYLTGLEIPAGGRATDVGVLMHNVGTAYAVQQAIRHNRPLISRVITVSGGAVAQPRNVEAPLGTPLAALLEYCGYGPENTARLVMGGPMMGDALPHANVPLIKGAAGILALTPQEISACEAKSCIRCARCVSACPVGLLPLEMMARIRAGQLESALKYGLKDCISCGSCSYVCPSEIPLVHYFKYANGELMASQQAQHKTEQTRKLAEEKQMRLERHRRELAEQAAARKAQAQARQAQQAAREVRS